MQSHIDDKDNKNIIVNNHDDDYDDWTSNNVFKPKCFIENDKFLPKNKLLMIPGPTNLNLNVLKSLSIPILSHTDEQLYQLLFQIQDGIRYLFQTKNLYTFALTGSATLAMEASLCNILKPGEKLLSLVHGYWGERIASMARRLSFQSYTLKTEWFGQNFTLLQIEKALQKYQPNLMYVCHGDSSLGSVQCLNGIGNLCHKYGCLLLVDAVVSLCSTPLAMDQMEIDVLYSGCQKALSGPPGLALISFSPRAMKKIRARSKTHPITSFYMDIELIAKAWGIENNGLHTYHYTPAINLLYGLRASIQEIVNEGLEKIIDRHQLAKKYLEKRIQEIGLNFLIKNPKNRLAGITSVLIPNDIDGTEVMKFLYQKHDILIGGSLFANNKTIPKFWRIGYLGVNADSDKIDLVLDAMKDALLKLQKYKIKFKPHL